MSLKYYRVMYKSLAPDQHTPLTRDSKINFVWPKIVPGRRRCPLVRGPDKGGFTVYHTLNPIHLITIS